MREIRSRRRAVRLSALAGLVAVLVAVAAGCGGGGGGSSNTTTGNSSVSGSVKFWGIWAADGAEGVPEGDRRLPQAVPERHGHLRVEGQRHPDGAVDRDCRRQPARHGRRRAAGPREAARAAGEAEADQLRASRRSARNFTPAWEELGEVNGKLYALLYKAVEQIDPLVQRQRPQAGRGRRAEDVVADGQRGQDDQGVGHTRVLALRSERVDPHRHLREPLPPQVGAGEVRPAQRPPDQVDRSDGDQVAAGHGSGRRRHREHLWRYERRSTDRLPDVRGLHVRGSAEGGVQPPGRLREPRDPPGDEGEGRGRTSTSSRSRRSPPGRTRRPSRRAAT